MGEGMAKLSLLLILVGAHLTFIPMVAGRARGPAGGRLQVLRDRRLDTYNLLSTIGAFVLATGIVVSLVERVVSASAGSAPGPTRGAATRSSGSPLPAPAAQLRRRSPTSAAASRCATSATPSRPQPAAPAPAAEHASR